MRFVTSLGLAVLLGACSSTDSPELPRFLRGGDASAATDAVVAGVPVETAAARRAGDALFAQAEAATDPNTKADLYGAIVSEHPGHPRAAEARYLQGRSYYQAGEWEAAINTLKEYMTDSAVNPHLAQVEEMIYQSALRWMGRERGILGIFDEQGTGLEALRYIPVVFPAGRYADDAILYLARHFRDEGELQRSSLYYKELLQRYPDSEWSFEARRELGATYALRDSGGPYHAGFVDRDPREAVPGEDPKAAAFAGPVKSSLEMALTEYDKYLERIRRDPGRRAEYAQRVREVEAQKAEVRARLAEKDDRIAAWYAGQGDARAAEVYRRSAARWRGATDTRILPDVGPQPLPPAGPETPAVPQPSIPRVAVPSVPQPGVPQPGLPPSEVPLPPQMQPSVPAIPPPPPMPTVAPRVPAGTTIPRVPTSTTIPRVPTGTTIPRVPAGTAIPRVPPPPPPPSWPPSR